MNRLKTIWNGPTLKASDYQVLDEDVYKKYYSLGRDAVGSELFDKNSRAYNILESRFDNCKNCNSESFLRKLANQDKNALAEILHPNENNAVDLSLEVVEQIFYDFDVVHVDESDVEDIAEELAENYEGSDEMVEHLKEAIQDLASVSASDGMCEYIDESASGTLKEMAEKRLEELSEE